MNIFANRSIGVEFDDYEIRTVELQKRPGGIHLAGCHRVSLPPDIVKDGRVAKPKELSEYIKSLWTNNKLYKDNIILDYQTRIYHFRKITCLWSQGQADFAANNAQDYILHRWRMRFWIIW